MQPMTPLFTPDELNALLRRQVPDAAFGVLVQEMVPNGLIAVMPAQSVVIRPGGFVNGPTLMAFADIAMFLAIQAFIGENVMIMTRSLTINFVEAMPAGDVEGHAQLVQLSKRNATGHVTFRAAGKTAVNAVAQLSFSIPVQ
jgi:uncharacterized protein (TIGR00369 family)